MSYDHINDKERFYIEQILALGERISDIAIVLGRHKSTIYREINHNTNKFFGLFSGLRADTLATTLLPFKTITSDNGTEFASHEFISDEHKLNWYFYPKKTDFRNCTDDIQKVQNILNNRPRKKLGFITPRMKIVQMLGGL